MFARTPSATRSPVLALVLALVLLLTQQFGLQHGVLHLRGGPVDRWSTSVPGAGQVAAAKRVALAAADRTPGSATDSSTDSSTDGSTDGSTDILCPVCLVLAAIGAATLVGLLRWLVTLQASEAPSTPARRTPARPARRQHHARAPPVVLALS